MSELATHDRIDLCHALETTQVPFQLERREEKDAGKRALTRPRSSGFRAACAAADQIHAGARRRSQRGGGIAGPRAQREGMQYRGGEGGERCGIGRLAQSALARSMRASNWRSNSRRPSRNTLRTSGSESASVAAVPMSGWPGRTISTYRMDYRGFREHGSGHVLAVRQNNHWTVDAPPSGNATVMLPATIRANISGGTCPRSRSRSGCT